VTALRALNIISKEENPVTRLIPNNQAPGDIARGFPIGNPQDPDHVTSPEMDAGQESHARIHHHGRHAQGLRPLIWDETRIDRLKEFWAEGKSALAIAAEFGTTKNAVIGKINRLGLAFKQGKPTTIEAEALSKAASVSQADDVPTPARNENSMTKFGQELIEAAEEALAVARGEVEPAGYINEEKTITNPTGRKLLALFDLKLSSCRWPIGDPRDESFGFCGKRKENAAHPYCDACRRLAVSPSAGKRRAEVGIIF
jgi:GcrA cell cycle regulator